MSPHGSFVMLTSRHFISCCSKAYLAELKKYNMRYNLSAVLKSKPQDEHSYAFNENKQPDSPVDPDSGWYY